MLSLIMSCVLLTQESTSKPLSLKVAEGFVFVESNRKVIFATDKEGIIKWTSREVANSHDKIQITSIYDLATAQKRGFRRPGGYPPDTIFVESRIINEKGHPMFWIFSGKDGKLIGGGSD